MNKELKKKIDQISEMTTTIWLLFEGMHDKKKSDITFHQYLTLENIRSCPNCSVNDLAKKMKIAQSTASQLVDRLVQAKLVTRVENPENRRAMLINLSEYGEKALKRQREYIERGYYELLTILNPEDQEKLLKSFQLLFEIGKNLEKKLGGAKK